MEKAQAKSGAERGAILVRSTAHRRKRRAISRSVLLDGCLGFGLSLGNAALMLVQVRMPHAGRGFLLASWQWVRPRSSPSLLLRCGQLLTDVDTVRSDSRACARAVAEADDTVAAESSGPLLSGRRGAGECASTSDARRRSVQARARREACRGETHAWPACTPRRFVLAALFRWMGVLGGFPGMRQRAVWLRHAFLYGRFLGGLGAQGAHVRRRCPVHVRGGDVVGALRRSGFPTSGAMVSVSMAVSVMVTLLFGFHSRMAGGEFGERRRLQRPQHQGEGQQPHAAAASASCSGRRCLRFFSRRIRARRWWRLVGSAVGVAGILSLMLRQT